MIRFGLWFVATREEKDGPVIVCARCGTELNPNKFLKACELEFLYCSEECVRLEIKDYEKQQRELEALA